MVDTCAAPSSRRQTPYYYSTYDQDGSSDAAGTAGRMTGRRHRKVLVLGSGPIRIGQGIEFDYCSVHSCLGLASGWAMTIIIISNNPETVSTDFDVADKLYFEPLTAEDVQAVVELEKPWGAVVAVRRADRHRRWLEPSDQTWACPSWAPPPAAWTRPRDRGRFDAPVGGPVRHPPGPARPHERHRRWKQALAAAGLPWAIPVWLRPSYVLAARAW
ncbi:MAG: hypothetical protein ACLT9P_07840 [Evtepia gabavorous]